MNKIVKYCPLLVILFLNFTSIEGQQRGPNISFDEIKHDFGTIAEDNGNVTHNFTFRNTGSEPLIITKVTASCGCTSPGWTKEPVLPGATGYVSATYNPKNRPGRFEKTVTVYSNAPAGRTVLKIAGDVIPKAPTIEEKYPQQIGELRLKSKHLAFSKIYHGKTKTRDIDIINTGKVPISISFASVPAHLQVNAHPAKLAPGATGKISITYDAKLKNDWGHVIDRFNILTNGNSVSDGVITITATIEEDFSNLTPYEKANAPRIEFNETVFNFGHLKKGEAIDKEFVFENTGKRDLVIRKISSSCGCTTVSPSSDIIKPGESSSLKVNFDSRGKNGRQNKAITIITNDPENHKSILWVKGEVES